MITPTLPAVGDPTERGWAQAVIDALVDLNSGGGGGGGGGSSGSLLLNGSFEIDADADSEPDNWTITTQTNGAFTLAGHSLADTNCVSGARSIKFTSIGGASNGGGQAVSDFFEVSPLRPLKIDWMWYCTSTTAANFVKIDFYDAAQAFISPTVTVFEKISAVPNPTTWSQGFGCAVPPATARYAKVTLIGCDSSAPTACSTYFDAVSVRTMEFLRRVEYHGNGASGARSYNFVPLVTGPHRITLFGAGGGGASRSSSSAQPGGGGGAMAQSVIYLTAGTNYALEIGAGGAGGASGASANGANGQSTTFDGTKIIAAGGSGGVTAGAAGAGGLAASCTGDVKIAGNAGSVAVGSASGHGGPSVFGLCGGYGVASGNDGVAPDSRSFGAGGSGSYTIGAAMGGGDGGSGGAVIEW